MEVNIEDASIVEEGGIGFRDASIAGSSLMLLFKSILVRLKLFVPASISMFWFVSTISSRFVADVILSILLFKESKELGKRSAR